MLRLMKVMKLMEKCRRLCPNKLDRSLIRYSISYLDDCSLVLQQVFQQPQQGRATKPSAGDESTCTIRVGSIEVSNHVRRPRTAFIMCHPGQRSHPLRYQLRCVPSQLIPLLHHTPTLAPKPVSGNAMARHLHLHRPHGCNSHRLESQKCCVVRR